MRIGPRKLHSRLAACALFAVVAAAALAQEVGSTLGNLTVNGSPIRFPYAYVFHEEHPFNAGEEATVIKLTTEEVDKRDLSSPFVGGSSVTVRFAQDGQVYGRDLFLRTDEGTNSVSGLNFSFSLTESGPEEYRGTIDGSVDHFDDRYDFSIQFAAAQLSNSGMPLPPDGGAPGDAYRDHFEIMSSGDFERIRAAMPEEQLAAMKETGMTEAELLEFLSILTPSEMTVVGGEQEGNMAYLEVTMVMAGQPGTGTVTMEEVEGKWRVVNEAWRQ